MSVSVAVVTNKNRPYAVMPKLLQSLQKLKYVKSMDGSCYAIDRRTGPQSPTQHIDPAMLANLTDQSQYRKTESDIEIFLVLFC